MMHAEEQASTASPKTRDWWNDPLGVFKQGAGPTALKIHGFIIGLFFGIIGIVAVALLSSAEKRTHRLIGAGAGLVVSLPVWILVSGA